MARTLAMVTALSITRISSCLQNKFDKSHHSRLTYIILSLGPKYDKG
jgi:hypothetical protein